MPKRSAIYASVCARARVHAFILDMTANAHANISWIWTCWCFQYLRCFHTWCHHVLPLQRLSNFSSRIQIVWSGSLGSLCFNSFRWGGCRRWWLWGPGELVPPESCDLVSCWRRVQYFSFTYWTIKMAISAACINVDIVQLSFLGWYGRQRSLCHKGGLSSIAILRASFLSQRWAETSCSFFFFF